MLGKRYALFLILSFVGASVMLLATPRPESGAEAGASPIVTTQQGKLRGTLNPDGSATFLAIPYAAPPVGELRWKAPQEPKSWTGIRDATTPPHACMQVDWGWNSHDAKNSSEDCLYLNIVTPSLHPAHLLPVLFWIHGGANYNGSGVGFVKGETLTRHGVVLVSINYRLGVFGFLALPELARESAHHSSGNYGLLDQIAALRWVHNNIARFGGDPRKVTIAGQSAGAIDVGMLLASPEGKGLFARAISESGGAISPVPVLTPLREAEARGGAFAASAGAPAGPHQIAALRAMTARQVLKAGLRFTAPDKEGVPTHPGPSLDIDGWVLPEQPAALVREGAVNHVPYLIGSNVQEFSFTRSSVIRPGSEPADALRKRIRQDFGNEAPAAIALYGLDHSSNPAPDPLLGTVGTQLMTDTYFRCPAIIASGWLAAKGFTIWQYRFERPLPGSASTRHSGELPYVFGWAQKTGAKIMGATFGPQDARTSKQMQGYWIDFVKTGDPNGPGLPKWPRYTDSGAGVLRFTSKGPVPARSSRLRLCGLYEKHIETLLADPKN